MTLVRALVLLLLLASAGCLCCYLYTGDERWRTRGVVLLRWTVLAGLGFFGVLMLERLSA